MEQSIAEFQNEFHRVFEEDLAAIIRERREIPAFVMALVGVDVLAGYRFPENANEARFLKFIRKYFSEEYAEHATGLWKLRIGLVHDFHWNQRLTVGRNEEHLTGCDARLTLNAENIHVALVSAAKHYFAELEAVEEVRQAFLRQVGLRGVSGDSRQSLLDRENQRRAEMRAKLLDEINEGDVRKGTVKNIADFGAFVDLGGIDGLLHITDMSWGRINHPSEVVKLEQEITVKVLKVDRVTERIALGLKQLQPNPWERVVSKYTVTQRVRGKVVNLMPYGAFVELEAGVEGLVHISEMSWTKRINHPSEVLQPGQEVEVAVLAIDTDKQELSLGLKQTEANPWDKVDEKYKAGMKVAGKVRNTTIYGAFVELEDGIDGLLHINDMSWTKKVVHPSEMVKKGDKIDLMVISVDKEKKLIALGLKQVAENPWQTTIPIRYAVGNAVSGKVTKLASFGAFVELEKDLKGLLHISKVDKGTEQAGLNPGDTVEVRVVKVEPNEGKIELSLVTVVEKAKTPQPVPAVPAAPATAPPAEPTRP